MVRLGVLVTTHNDGLLAVRCLRSVCGQIFWEVLEGVVVVCVDDGSEVPVESLLDFKEGRDKLEVVRIEHSERTAARETGLAILREKGVAHFIFLDSDMVLPPGFLRGVLEHIERFDCDGAVIPEEAFSEYGNYWTRVKVFERNLYRVSCPPGPRNIEAARLWRMDDFPGFMPGLNAFEEIQPTLKALKQGKHIDRLDHLYVLHDEKHITLSSLLKKKRGYFSVMGENGSVGLLDVLDRFYFFRPQLYNPRNLKLYVRHPILFLGVVSLYTMQSILATVGFLKGRLENC